MACPTDADGPNRSESSGRSGSARLRAFRRQGSYDPAVTHSGLTAVDWTAIGTLALAGATVAAIIVAQVQARKDRQRGDAERLAEIKRDDRLRREATEERELRETAERRAREDYQARQVVVTVGLVVVPVGQEAASTHRITVSTPHAYPIKWLDGRWVLTRSGNLSIVGFGFGADKPTVDENRTAYSFRANIPSTDPDAEPIIRFVDWHDNQYYQYRHYTERFGQNTDFTQAAIKIDEWIRTGPKAD
jgi:hypothetical protein